MSENKDYSTQHEILKAKREKQLDRDRELAEAMAKTLKKAYTQILKDEDHAKQAAEELKAVRQGKYTNPAAIDRLMGAGARAGKEGMGVNADLEGNITGFEERYWDQDES